MKGYGRTGAARPPPHALLPTTQESIMNMNAQSMIMNGGNECTRRDIGYYEITADPDKKDGMAVM